MGNLAGFTYRFQMSKEFKFFWGIKIVVELLRCWEFLEALDYKTKSKKTCKHTDQLHEHTSTLI